MYVRLIAESGETVHNAAIESWREYGEMESVSLVAFGDSVTNGVGHHGVREEETFRALVGRRVARELGTRVQVVNAGVNGDVTPTALQRIEPDVLRRRPRLVMVMFGVNDAGYYRPDTDSFAESPRVSEDEFTRCFRDILVRLQSAGVTTVVLTPLPMSPGYWGADLPQYVDHGLNFLVERYANCVRRVAAARGVRVVDTYAHFRNLGDATRLLPDGIHPTAEGHRIIGDLVGPAVTEALR